MFVETPEQPAKPVIPNKIRIDNGLMNLFSIFQVSPKPLSPYNAHLGSFPRISIPHLGDHISWANSDNWFKVKLSMTPKYDLIYRQGGEIKFKQIMAVDIEDAISKGKLEKPDLKGIVYSDQNKERNH